MANFWFRHTTRYREKSMDGERELEDSAVEVEELCRSNVKRIKF
jgi:hypothetical protein